MDKYIVLDIETTGISPEFEAMTEIGAAYIEDGQVIRTFNQLINPGKSIPPQIVLLTGITDVMVADAPSIEAVIPLFIDFCGDLPILGHNVIFDYSFLKTAAKSVGQPFEKKALDTMVLSRQFMKDQRSHSLTNLIANLGIDRNNAHRGLDDALATYEIYELIKRRHKNEMNAKYFVPKPLFYRPKKQSPITDKQKKFLSSLIRQHKVGIDYEIDTLTKSEASKKIDGILSTYGRKL